MVDLHTHILPATDDGARDLQTSLEMLKALQRDGVTDVTLTPHFYMRRQNPESFLRKRREAFERLSAAAPAGMRLHLGAETEFSEVLAGYDKLKELSIDGGRYILIELPFSGDYKKGVLPKIERFIYSTGLTPIIAHVERYPSIRKKPALVAELIDRGCLLQMNTTSIVEARAGSLEDALLKSGQVHLIGTDCHDMGSRKPDYAAAIACVEQRYGKECLSALLETAERVMRGERIYAESGRKIRKLFGRYY